MYAQTTSRTSTTTKTVRTVVHLSAAMTAAAFLIGSMPAAGAAQFELSGNARKDVVELTNDARSAKGCKPLKFSSRLQKAAQGHADDMSQDDYFSHTSDNGRSWDQRIRKAGYKKPAGENIAYGQESAEEVTRAWMNSPGHRRNILDCSFVTIGVGYNADGDYWVQDFGY